MYSISVQGIYASGFEFKNNSGQEFRSFVESLTMNCATLVSSHFRTDLLYYSTEDHHKDELMKLWCKIGGKDYSTAIEKRFNFSEGELDVLQNYFTSLVYLARIPKWFYEYGEELNLMIDQEPNHPIHRKILGCARHLVSKKPAVEIPHILADHHSIAHYLFKNNKTFALQAAKGYLSN